MSYSEAVEAVGRLIAAFPNGSPANAKGYIGALAAVLADYPRVVSAKCADPLQGVARDTRFMPTVADLVGWCEREKATLQQIVDRDDYNRTLAKQAQERAAATAKLEQDRTARPTLQQMQDKYGPNWGLTQSEKEDLTVKAARDAKMVDANRHTFERECREAGIDPAGGVSPSLRKILTDAETTEARMRRAEEHGRHIDRVAARAAWPHGPRNERASA